MFKSLLLKLWTKFKAPIVIGAAALAALGIAMLEMFKKGQRSEKQKEIERGGKDEAAKIDEMADAGDADGLLDDVMRRTDKKD